MANQKEIIKAIEENGFYEAQLRKHGRSTRGQQDVNTAKKLVEKGVLRLSSEVKEPDGEDWTIFYRFEKVG